MHKSFWFQIHWFLGIVFGLTLILIGISGAVWSYQKEIMRLINPNTYTVQVPQKQEILTVQDILEKYQEQNKDRKINSISFSSDKSSSVSINLTSLDPNNRRGETIYLNPYTAEVLPELVGSDFFNFFFRLHRWLTFSGDVQYIGKNIVAISTIACIILTIGGLIVYWPRVRRSFAKSMTFSFKHKNRAFLSTMHSAIGLWVLIPFLLMCLTGLYWSYDWYRSAMFTVMGVEQPKRQQQQTQAPQQQTSQVQGEQRQQRDGQQGQRVQKQPQVISYETAQKVVDIFNQNVARDYKNASLRLTSTKEGTYTISYLYADATHFRETNSMEIDPNKALLVKEAKYSDKKLNEKIMSSMLPVHSGEFFGWIGQLIFFISSALMSLFVITGYMLYYDRWKKKRDKALKEKTTI
ncbi:PepSY-associated TM helix domain-containing protein [Aliarcobacter skirrowii]|uniref:PepSY-associated TM helix domain-containing protein n=1 Tax=Aliarcobacter skirrowii TaxID=28200 RepID=UPI0029A46003|nr:PepSY-associated TM helix domain-containing protein [Aliarcobacter skirrowii]MDX4026296.1 PepSY-associated TM helix domain-containing protein [Aliarcobacter skirrowii]